MLKTKIYFAGSAKLTVDRQLQEWAYPRLMSQLNDRSLIPKWTSYYHDVNPNISIFIDSGAYSAYTKGATIDVDAYINWINTHGDAFTVIAQVDFIPGKSNLETDAEVYLKAPQHSWENYLYMHERLRPELRDKLIPVFHQGENFKWLKNMINWVDPETGRHMPYIGVSPHTEVTSANRLSFCRDVFRIIKNSDNPTVCTHGFGMTALQLLKNIPFTSVDSTTWLQSAIHGQILLPRGGKLSPVVVSERTVHLDNHFIYMSPDVQDEIVKQIEVLGYSADCLRDLQKLAVPKSQRLAATPEIVDDLEAEAESENLANQISERQLFNARSMQHYLEVNDFEGLPKTPRKIGG